MKMTEKQRREIIRRTTSMVNDARWIAQDDYCKVDRRLPRLVRQIRVLLAQAHAKPEEVWTTSIELRQLGNLVFYFKPQQPLENKTPPVDKMTVTKRIHLNPQGDAEIPYHARRTCED